MDKKMRIALLLTGGLRNFEDTFSSFKHFLLDVNNIDVFFYGLENNKGREENIRIFEKLFNPKDYVINDQKYYDDIPVNPSYIKTSYFSFHNVFKCNQLKNEYARKHNINYDLIIRCRLDTFWFRSISFEELNLSKDNILTPMEWSFKEVNSFALSDIFCITSPELMDKYCELYNKIDYYCETIKFHPESLVGYHIMYNKLPHKEIGRHFIFEYPMTHDTYFGNFDKYAPKGYQFVNQFDGQNKNRKDND